MTLHQPLLWPTHVASGRQPAGTREPSRYRASLEQTIDDLVSLCARRGYRELRITSNLELNRAGTAPLKRQAEPDDPGVAVYWVNAKLAPSAPRVFACDAHPTVRENLRAVYATLVSVGPDFWGWPASHLDARPVTKAWREVLGFTMQVATPEALRKARRQLLAENHPDRGGSVDTFRAIEVAYADALEEIGS